MPGQVSIPNVGNVSNVSGTGSMSESEAVEELFKDIPKGKGKGNEETEDAEIEDAEVEGSEDEGDADAEDAEDEEVLDKEEDTEDDANADAGSFGPVDKKALLAKYPKLFKDFPELGNTFQREQKFTELFPTVEDAETASAMAQEYNGVGRKIMVEGDATFLLNQIHRTNPQSFERFTDNFLEGVRRVDRDQYNAICEPVIQNVLRWCYVQGSNHNNENIINSARHLSKLIFGTAQVEELEPRKKPTKSNEPDPERVKLDKERAEFENGRFVAASNEIGESIDDFLRDELSGNIDPSGKMSSYFKRTLIKDIIDGIHNQLKNEPAHGRTMKTLWDRARAANYPGELKTRIKNTYLARAKQILPAVRARVKQEAFRVGDERPKGDKPKSENGKSKHIPVGRALSNTNSSSNGGKKMPTGRDVDWRNTSERDILDGKYTPKSK
jgi:hypothetical protein